MSFSGDCRAGLFCIGRQFHAVGICPEGIYVETDGNVEVIRRGKYAKLYLKVTDDCIKNEHQFYFSTDGRHYTPVGAPFAMRAGFWKGIRVGLFCYGDNGQAQFDYFRMGK